MNLEEIVKDILEWWLTDPIIRKPNAIIDKYKARTWDVLSFHTYYLY